MDPESLDQVEKQEIKAEGEPEEHVVVTEKGGLTARMVPPAKLERKDPRANKEMPDNQVQMEVEDLRVRGVMPAQLARMDIQEQRVLWDLLEDEAVVVQLDRRVYKEIKV